MSHDHYPQQTATHPQQEHSSESNNSNNSNATYRPRSPDLSAYVLPVQNQPTQQQQSHIYPSYQDSDKSGGPSWQQQQQQQQQQQRQGSSAALTGLPGNYPLATHRGSYDASPYFSPQGQGQDQGGYFVGGSSGIGASAGSQPQQQGQRRETLPYGTVTAAEGVYSRLTQSPTSTAGATGETFSLGRAFPSQQVQTHGQQGFWQAPLAGYTVSGHEQFQSLSASHPQHPPQQNMPPVRRKRGQPDDNDDSGDFDYAPESSNLTGGAPGGKPSRKRKSDSGQNGPTGRAPGEVGPSLGIDIKTKFPVARIKRIMQADEDVGKVAQATPTAVCKLTAFVLLCYINTQADFSFSEGTRAVYDNAGDQSSG
jgi:Histone-like transcription factor (CBF/NF-Y) and archaeal histone